MSEAATQDFVELDDAEFERLVAEEPDAAPPAIKVLDGTHNAIVKAFDVTAGGMKARPATRLEAEKLSGKPRRTQSDDSSDSWPDEAPLPAQNSVGDDILDLLGDPNKTLVIKKEIEVAGELKDVWIKQLSIRQNNWIESQKFRRGAGGAITFDARNADTNMTAHLLHLAVVKNVGTAVNPVWASRWTLEQLLGTPAHTGKPARVGLMDSADINTKLLIFSLASLCMEVNSDINPTVTVPED